MTVTLTATYRETLAPETVALIDEYTERDYDLQAMLVFIDENSEESFGENYPLYVDLGEDYGFLAVDAWIKHTTVDDLGSFQDAYIGEFYTPREMAEDYFDGETDSLDYRIVIDWAETAEYLLDHEVDRVGDFYFRCNY